MKRTNGPLWANCQSAKATLAFLPLIPFAISFVRCGGGGRTTTFTLPRASTLSTSGSVLPVTALSREVGSTGGGTSVTITGSGFQPGAIVLFGDVAAPWMIVVSSTEIRGITPSRPTSGIVDVTVQNTDGSTGTLVNGFDYEPAPSPSGIYFSDDFESGIPTRPDVNAVGAGGGQIPVISTTFHNSGVNSVKCVIAPSIGISTLGYTFQRGGVTEANPALTNPNGLYIRRYILFTPETLINIVNHTCGGGVTVCGQIKLSTARSLNFTTGLGTWSFWDEGIGPAFTEIFGSPPVTSHSTLINQESAGLEGPWNTNVVVQANRWYEIETWYKRDSTIAKGRGKMWIDGRLVADTGWVGGMGGEDPTVVQTYNTGAAYAEQISGTVTVYLDDVAAADGFIEPVP